MFLIWLLIITALINGVYIRKLNTISDMPLVKPRQQNHLKNRIWCTGALNAIKFYKCDQEIHIMYIPDIHFHFRWKRVSFSISM